MRLHGLMLAILCSAFLNTTYTYAQAADAHPTEEQQLEPYHKHRDTRHGHDHSYPDRGSVIRDLPRGTIGVSYAGLSYRFHDGIWLEPRGPAFIVVAPPIGLVVPNLPRSPRYWRRADRHFSMPTMSTIGRGLTWAAMK